MVERKSSPDWSAGGADYDRKRTILRLMESVNVPLEVALKAANVPATDLTHRPELQTFVFEVWALLKRKAAEALYEEMQKVE